MKRIMSEAMEMTVRTMLDSCATTAQICDKLLVSPSAVQKIRNKMKTERRIYDYWNPMVDSRMMRV